MGDLRIMYWPRYNDKDDFHWARMSPSGTWLEKRGESGLYVWHDSNSMCRDVARLGYSLPILCRLND